MKITAKLVGVFWILGLVALAFADISVGDKPDLDSCKSASDAESGTCSKPPSDEDAEIEDEDDTERGAKYEKIPQEKASRIPLNEGEGQDILEMFEETLRGGKAKSKVAPVQSEDFQKIMDSIQGSEDETFKKDQMQKLIQGVLQNGQGQFLKAPILPTKANKKNKGKATKDKKKPAAKATQTKQSDKNKKKAKKAK